MRCFPASIALYLCCLSCNAGSNEPAGDNPTGGSTDTETVGDSDTDSDPAAEYDETLHKAASLLGCFRPASE